METKQFSSIKELVFSYVRQQQGKVDPHMLEAEVKKHFPHSKWKESHWAWYRNQIKSGRYKDQFTEFIKRNLPFSLGGPNAADPAIKLLGDQLLKMTRKAIVENAGENDVMKFKLNRWVYGRLMQDEIRQKRPIKQQLWDSGIHTCQSCRKHFNSLKGVEIHRKDGDLPYSIDNCQLLCRPCHQKMGRIDR
jgi:hypothetical protein